MKDNWKFSMCSMFNAYRIRSFFSSFDVLIITLCSWIYWLFLNTKRLAYFRATTEYAIHIVSFSSGWMWLSMATFNEETTEVLSIAELLGKLWNFLHSFKDKMDEWFRNLLYTKLFFITTVSNSSNSNGFYPEKEITFGDSNV